MSPTRQVHDSYETGHPTYKARRLASQIPTAKVPLVGQIPRAQYPTLVYTYKRSTNHVPPTLHPDKARLYSSALRYERARKVYEQDGHPGRRSPSPTDEYRKLPKSQPTKYSSKTPLDGRPANPMIPRPPREPT
jgi:hypothetical protein